MSLTLTSGVCFAKPPPSISLQQALGGGGEEYLQADAPRHFIFPRDHAPHDGFQTEWWHLVGALKDERGRSFGFQTSLFRIALIPPAALTFNSAAQSQWRASHVWMAHAALTDVKRQQHFSEERFAREALELAGAREKPFALWVGDWQLQADDDFNARLIIAAENFEFDFAFAPQRAPTLQGDDGLSKKGAAAEQASYYYSITRMHASGELTLRGGEKFKVNGLAWLDREWSSNALAPEQTGWDWFALNFHDGGDLMFYQLRRGDGRADMHSAGVFTRDNKKTRLHARDVTLTPLRRWRGIGGAYPIAWLMKVAPLEKVWEVRAVLEDQEMTHSVHYWEGLVEIFEDGELVGRGYLEMTGYD